MELKAIAVARQSEKETAKMKVTTFGFPNRNSYNTLDPALFEKKR